MTAKRFLWSRRFTDADRHNCEKVGVSPALGANILDLWRVARGTESYHDAVVELAHALGYIKDTTRDRMRAELVDTSPRPASPKPRSRPKPSTTANPDTDSKPRSGSVPHWDHESRELRYRGRVVRTVKRPGQANNIVALLRAFEKAGWPPRIDDPFHRKSNDETRRRDVETLNKRLDTTLMFFECDGDGKGFLWKRTPRAKAKKAAKRRRRRTKPS